MNDSEKLDLLAVGAHPDDVEMSCGGTLCLLVDQGYRVGIVDLTRGELGSRGSAELRAKEAEEARRIMGVPIRVNLGIPDGDITNTDANRRKLMAVLRRYRPDIVLINPVEERHPDHRDAAQLCASAIYYSGLVKLETRDDDGIQAPWRPAHIMHYMQSLTFEPEFVVDVSAAWGRRTDAVLAYSSQVHVEKYKETSDEPETFISDPGFIQFLEARARTFGYGIGAEYGEGFLYRHGPVGVKDLPAFLGTGRRV